MVANTHSNIFFSVTQASSLVRTCVRSCVSFAPIPSYRYSRCVECVDARTHTVGFEPPHRAIVVGQGFLCVRARAVPFASQPPAPVAERLFAFNVSVRECVRAACMCACACACFERIYFAVRVHFVL